MCPVLNRAFSGNAFKGRVKVGKIIKSAPLRNLQHIGRGGTQHVHGRHHPQPDNIVFGTKAIDLTEKPEKVRTADMHHISQHVG